MPGRVTNNTNEVLFFYGAPHPDFSDYDNGVYALKPRETSAATMDADGFYVPADRKFKQLSGSIVSGPVAVKYVRSQHPVITQEGAIYVVDADSVFDEINFGVFKPSERCKPSQWPLCVNWFIPNFTYPEALAGEMKPS